SFKNTSLMKTLSTGKSRRTRISQIRLPNGSSAWKKCRKSKWKGPKWPPEKEKDKERGMAPSAERGANRKRPSQKSEAAFFILFGVGIDFLIFSVIVF